MTDTFTSIGEQSATLTSRWAWYFNALRGNFGPIHESDPQQGYYRTRTKGKPWEPVAIFYPEGSDELVAYRNGKEVDDIYTAWTWCCRNPVSYDDYQAAIDGKGWSDEDKVVADQVKPRDPVAGDNSGDVDATETIKDQIESAIARLASYENIADDDTASKGLSLRNRLNELSGEADKIRTKEKAPHLEAGKAVDAKWQPLVKKAKEGANKVRDAIGAWETVKYQRQQAEQRKAEDARKAAEEAAREQQGETAVLEQPATTAAPVEVAPAPIRASYGKAASVSVKTVIENVTDWPALAVYMSSHPENQELLRKLAQRALDAGRTNIPGITTTEEAKVR